MQLHTVLPVHLICKKTKKQNTEQRSLRPLDDYVINYNLKGVHFIFTLVCLSGINYWSVSAASSVTDFGVLHQLSSTLHQPEPPWPAV